MGTFIISVNFRVETPLGRQVEGNVYRQIIGEYNLQSCSWLLCHSLILTLWSCNQFLFMYFVIRNWSHSVIEWVLSSIMFQIIPIRDLACSVCICVYLTDYWNLIEMTIKLDWENRLIVTPGTWRQCDILMLSLQAEESTRELPAITYLKTPPSYSHFLREHLQKNQPCLISSDLVISWPALSLWVDSQGDPSATGYSQPNLDYFRDTYGDQIVSVARCSSRDFSDQEREERPLREVIDLWKSGNGNGLYVKDWHLAKSTREKGYPLFYETPQIFRDDWMNAFWEEEGEDDFRFVVSKPHGNILTIFERIFSIWEYRGHLHLSIEMFASP